jgi:manganese/zinc/iron transport system permease protein
MLDRAPPIHQLLTPAPASVSAPWLADGLWRVVSLQDYNTRVVLLGTILLGIGAGLLGVYLLLRRRVLIGDAISHATLPGVAAAYLWTSSQGGDKSLFTLLIGAAVSGSLGGMAVLALRHLARIREDAALGIVLSVFFGAGVALVSLVQQVPGGNAAGLEGFIYGKTASMTSEDVWLNAMATGLVALAIVCFGKELKLLCFDAELARSQGWPVLTLDALLIFLVVAVTIVGLQAVGLILIIALLVIPAASARFWTHDLNQLLLISALIGAVSCGVGTLLSAAYANLPSGATIVLSGCALFAFSFMFGLKGGVAWQFVRRRQLRREQEFQHLLRAAFEVLEDSDQLPEPAVNLKSSQPISLEAIGQLRGWTDRYTRYLAKQMAQAGLVVLDRSERLQLTPRGFLQALSTVRDHRLLEQYMIEEIAAPVGAADRGADYFEHGLLPEHLAWLERSLTTESPRTVPPSPHQLNLQAADPPANPLPPPPPLARDPDSDNKSD